ncbi:MAG: elongation factor G [Candidatus Omnitrophica bacterium]|nr:elongation factor G [bacterium]MCL4735156.1 elongation factor G [Candidatus Omnitrophota bacterium]NUP94316.1 elongation factor G [Candidatus Omnitrophota bacterium]
MVDITTKRNVAVVAHHGAGKTSLVEAFVYFLGKVDRLGRTNDGTTYSDFTDEEKDRKVSIHSSLIHVNYNKHSLNFLDLPGYADFIGEVKSCMHACGSAVFVINATSPVEVETEKSWEFADEFDLARLLVVNQLDKERTDFPKVVNALQEAFGARCVPIQVPIGKESGFKGVVDLIGMKAYTFDNKGKAVPAAEIPADCQDLIAGYREKMLDCAAEVDEAVMEKYLAGEELSQSEMLAGLKKAVSARTCVPILCASAYNTVGTQLVLDAIIDFLPSPDHKPVIKAGRPGNNEAVELKVGKGDPLSALVFKTRIDPHAGRLSFIRIFTGTMKPDQPILNATTGNVLKAHNLLQVSGREQTIVAEAAEGDIICIAKHDDLSTNDTLCAPGNPVIIPPTEFPPPTIQMAIHAVNKADEEKMGIHLHKIEMEDPTLTIRRDPETNEAIIMGMGELHLDTVVYHLKHYAKIEVEMTLPKVAYRETVTAHAEGMHRHKKQSGGRGQFGEVHLKVDPLPPGSGFEFVNEVVGGVIPTKFIPAVEKGVHESLQKGILAGYPVVDVRATVFYGKDHPVDSSEAAFKIAGAICFRTVAREAKPILLEPVVLATIEVPEEYMGDTMSDVSSRRGKVLGMDSIKGKQIIKAHIPLSEMFRYSIDLRAITRGRGSFRMEFDHYAQVPAELTSKIVAGTSLADLEE